MHKVVFRVDSSLEIGGGHLRRCLALAAELRTQGAEIAFICRDHRGNLNSEVIDSDFILRELPSGAAATRKASNPPQHAGWLAASPENDAAETLQALSGWGDPSALVVDHYGVDATWEHLMRKQVPRIVAIDDLADRQHACDVLVDSTPFGADQDRYARLVGAGTELLLGARYALLRSEFFAMHQSPRRRDGIIRRILVSFGAVDAGGYTLRVTQALQAAVGRDVQFDVVVGEKSRDLASLTDYSAAQPSIRLHIGTRDIAVVMQKCDMAVISSGVTAMECACMGLPAIVVPIAPNQTEMARSLCAIPCALSVRADSDFDRKIAELAIVLLSQSQLVEALGRNARELVDGRGAARVARAVLPAEITIRRAGLDDMHAIWEWRNQERVRSMSRSIAPIPWDDHESWYRQALTDPCCALLIAQRDNRAIAVIRFDLSADGAEISIYLTTDAQGTGLARRALIAAESWVKDELPRIHSIQAEVRSENSASSAAFTQAGYVLHALRFRKELSDKNGH